MKMAPQEIRTFFLTSLAWGRCDLFKTERMALLLIDVMHSNRAQHRFELHEFVVMPNHFHVLLTPAYEIPLERAIQFIKGGFSYRVKRELGFHGPVWQPSFQNHRIRDALDYAAHREYILDNPHRAGLPDTYAYISSAGKWMVDPVPPGLKPVDVGTATPA